MSQPLSPVSVAKKVEDFIASGGAASLVSSRYLDQSNPYAGLSYAASEVVYHACGGLRSGLKVRFLTVDGRKEVHIFLIDSTGKIIDPTAKQFARKVDYSAAKQGSFVSTEPSVRSKRLAALAGVK